MKKLPPGYRRDEWNTWETFNRPRVGVARTEKNVRGNRRLAIIVMNRTYYTSVSPYHAHLNATEATIRNSKGVDNKTDIYII